MYFCSYFSPPFYSGLANIPQALSASHISAAKDSEIIPEPELETLNAASLNPSSEVLPSFSVKVIDTPGRGRGLLALRDFAPGDLIFGEYSDTFLFQEVAHPSEQELGVVFDGFASEFMRDYMQPLGMMDTAEAIVGGGEQVATETTCSEIEITNNDANEKESAHEEDGELSIRDMNSCAAVAPLCAHCFAPLLNPIEQLNHIKMLISTEEPAQAVSNISLSQLDANALTKLGFLSSSQVTQIPASRTTHFPSDKTADGLAAKQAIQSAFPDMFPDVPTNFTPPLECESVSATVLVPSVETGCVNDPSRISHTIYNGGLSCYSFFTTADPQFCSVICYHNAIKKGVLPITFPTAQTLAGFATGVPAEIVSTKLAATTDSATNSIASVPLSPAQLRSANARISAIQFSLSCNLQNLAINTWTTGLRMLHLYSSVIGTLRRRVLERLTSNTSDIDVWWTFLTDDDWADALLPFSSFTRPSYVAIQEEQEKQLQQQSRTTIPTSEEEDDESSPASAADVVDGFVSNFHTLIDTLWPIPEGFTSSPQFSESSPDPEALVQPNHKQSESESSSLRVISAASEVLCPFALIDALLGGMVSNTQLFGSIPPIALYAQLFNTTKAKSKTITSVERMTGHIISEWAKSIQQISGNEEGAGSALISGMFPWHACLNHCCRPNACVSSAFDCFQLLRSIPNPIPRSMASALYVRAIRPIQRGDEICISYIDGDTPDPLWDSQASMAAERDEMEASLSESVRERFGWACQCAICAARAKKRALNAKKRAQKKKNKAAVEAE